MRKQNCISVPVLPDGKYKIPKKEKKDKKKKNTIVASFHAKIGWKMPRKRKNKIFLPFPSDQTGNRKFQKKRRKFKKIKKYDCGFFSSKNRLEKAEKERK